MKFYGGVLGSASNEWLDFGSDPDHDMAFLAGLRSPSAWNKMTVCGYLVVKERRMAIWMNTETFSYLNSLADEVKILQRVNDPMTFMEVCTLWVLLNQWITGFISIRDFGDHGMDHGLHGKDSVGSHYPSNAMKPYVSGDPIRPRCREEGLFDPSWQWDM